LESAIAAADRFHLERLTLEAWEQTRAEWVRLHPERIDNPDSILRALLAWLAQEPTVRSPSLLPPGLVVVGAGLLLLPALLPQFAVYLAALGVVILGSAVWLHLRPLPPMTRAPLEPEVQSLIRGEATYAAVAEAIEQVIRVRSLSQVGDLIAAMTNQPGPFDWNEVAASVALKLQDPLRLGPLVKLLQDYGSSLADLEAAECDAARLESALADQRSALGLVFDRYGFEVASPEPEVLGQTFLAWFEQAERVRSYHAELMLKETELAGFLDANGVPAGGPVEDRIKILEERSLKAEIFRVREAEIHRLETETEGRVELSLALQDDLAAGECGSTQDDIRTLMEKKLALGETWESLLESKKEAERQIRQAEIQHSVELATKSYEGAKSRLEIKFRQLAAEHVRYAIERHAREKLRDQDLPDLIKRANERVCRFTAGRYRLRVGATPTDGLGYLEVLDTQDDRLHGFAELSTGTKVHVLLAIRLAQIEEQEARANGGALKFPLIVDEAMAVSDPAASTAIAESLLSLAEERQVIVFTNQVDEVDLFRTLRPWIAVHQIGAEMPKPADGGFAPLTETIRQSRIAEFDPRFPVGAHTCGALFPISPGDPRFESRVDQLVLSQSDQKFIDLLELARRELNEGFPRVEWILLSKQSWAQRAAAIEIDRAWETTKGCPYRLREYLRGLSRKAFQQRLLEQAEDWFSESGLVDDPPTESGIGELTKRLFDAPALSDRATAILTRAYVPTRMVQSLFDFE
jgi:hypothetical protein